MSRGGESYVSVVTRCFAVPGSRLDLPVYGTSDGDVGTVDEPAAVFISPLPKYIEEPIRLTPTTSQTR